MYKIKYKSYVLSIPKQVYLPSDDTYFFLDYLKKLDLSKYNSALEIGFGNALLALEVYDYVKSIDCVDINNHAINYLQDLKKEYSLSKLKVINSNLFNNLDKKYDLIIFNAPYVPSCGEDPNEEIDLATCGGENGSVIIHKFIEDLKDHLTKNGEGYLLFSSLNICEEIINNIKKYKLKCKIVDSKHLFFETLFIIKIYI